MPPCQVVSSGGRHPGLRPDHLSGGINLVKGDREKGGNRPIYCPRQGPTTRDLWALSSGCALQPNLSVAPNGPCPQGAFTRLLPMTRIVPGWPYGIRPLRGTKPSMLARRYTRCACPVCFALGLRHKPAPPEPNLVAFQPTAVAGTFSLRSKLPIRLLGTVLVSYHFGLHPHGTCQPPPYGRCLAPLYRSGPSTGRQPSPIRRHRETWTHHGVPPPPALCVGRRRWPL